MGSSHQRYPETIKRMSPKQPTDNTLLCWGQSASRVHGSRTACMNDTSENSRFSLQNEGKDPNIGGFQNRKNYLQRNQGEPSQLRNQICLPEIESVSS